MKIFGREPAALVGVVEMFLALLLTLNLFGLGQEEVGAIMAVVAAAVGAVVAYTTRDTLVSALVGLTKAGLILAVTYGAPLTDNQTSAAIAFVTVTLGYFLRTQTVSLDTPLSAPSSGAPVRVTNLT